MNWSHEEAKKHDIKARLIERCEHYNGKACYLTGVHISDYCERCLAAIKIDQLQSDLDYWHEKYFSYRREQADWVRRHADILEEEVAHELGG